MHAPPFSCGLEVALAVLGGKWKPLVLYHLAHSTNRYAELRRSIGNVSDKVLTQQLKELQADGVVERTDYQGFPRRVDYALTPFGRSLAASLAPLCEWGLQHADQVQAAVTRRSEGA